LVRVQRGLEGVTPPTREIRLLTKRGEYLTVEVTTMLEIREGRVLGALGLLVLVSR